MESPLQLLKEYASKWNCDILSQEFAEKMDQEDPLREFRARFCYPKKRNLLNVDISVEDQDEECIYFCGHSLGLQPKSVQSYLEKVLKSWADRGAESHFYGYLPAATCELYPKEEMAKLVGAYPDEIAIMNGLSVNLHLLLASFYQPTEKCHKILIEKDAFPSDMFVVCSQITSRRYTLEDSLILLKPRKGEYTLRLEDIISVIEENSNQIAVILLPGVQYYTGQVLDMKKITEVGHKNGCIVGFDLAHAVGNVDASLHEWNVDFAAWCTYKYLNAGAGSIAGIFVHECHTRDREENFPKLRGWWGVHPQTKFLMKNDEFDHCVGADMFKLSNSSPFLVCMLIASLDIFKEARRDRIRAKQFLLTGYLEILLHRYFQDTTMPAENSIIKILTPAEPKQRGSQLTLLFNTSIDVEMEFEKRGIICDTRKSAVRITPVPLYNSYLDVYRFIHLLRSIIAKANNN